MFLIPVQPDCWFCKKKLFELTSWTNFVQKSAENERKVVFPQLPVLEYTVSLNRATYFDQITTSCHFKTLASEIWDRTNQQARDKIIRDQRGNPSDLASILQFLWHKSRNLWRSFRCVGPIVGDDRIFRNLNRVLHSFSILFSVMLVYWRKLLSNY